MNKVYLQKLLPVEWGIWKIKSVFCGDGDLLHLHDPPQHQECDQEQKEAENQGCMTADQKCCNRTKLIKTVIPKIEQYLIEVHGNCRNYGDQD